MLETKKFLYLKGEHLAHSMRYENTVHFVVRGRIRSVPANRMYSKGTLVNYDCILKEEPQSNDYIVEDSILHAFSLTAENYLHLLSSFPDFKEELLQITKAKDKLTTKDKFTEKKSYNELVTILRRQL